MSIKQFFSHPKVIRLQTTFLDCALSFFAMSFAHRSPEAALLRQLWSCALNDPHAVHKPLPGPHHHLHHRHQCHHHVLRALQSTSCKIVCVEGGLCVFLNSRQSSTSIVIIVTNVRTLFGCEDILAGPHKLKGLFKG